MATRPQSQATLRSVSAERGIHLRGLTCPWGSPWAFRWGTVKARSVSTGLRRCLGHCARTLGNDELPVAHGGVGNGELKEAIEQHPAAARASTVEPKHELIEVGSQMGAIRRALVGSQQPSLGQRGNTVHRRQQASILPTGQSGTLAAPFVYIAQLVYPAVAIPTIGDNPSARLDMVRHKGV